MKNKTMKPITQNNEAISDEALKDVSGGAQWVEAGNEFTYQSGGSKIKVIDGSKCSSCGGTIGVFDINPDGSLCVKCEKCKTIILKSFRHDAVEMI